MDSQNIQTKTCLHKTSAGAFFTTYESVKSVLSKALPEHVPRPLVHSLASATAELASCVILTPSEVIKQNAQMIRGQSPRGSGSTSLQAFRMLQRSEGGASRRLWTGYTALAARNLPFTAMQFPMFEYIRAWLWHRRDGGGRASRKEAGGVEKSQGLLETGYVNGLSAAVSGSVAAVLTTPTDVVKTRMMLFHGEGEGHHAGDKAPPGGTSDKAPSRRRMSGLQVARDVYRDLGVRGLFRGGLLRAGWTALGSGLYLGTYEVAKVWLRRDETGQESGPIS